jgi:hypothetical protein
MASHFSRFTNFLFGALFGSIFGLTISVLPVFAIEHKRLITFFLHQPFPQLAFQILVVTVTALAWAHTCATLNKLNLPDSKDLKWIKANAFPLLATLFLFLYVACSYLCAKLHVALLPTSLVSKETWQWFGLVITFLSAVLILIALFAPSIQAAQATPHHGDRLPVEHPIYLAGLIYLLGSAISFTTWFPLMAIPGAFVALAWHIRGATVRDVRAPWRLLPYIY